MIILKAAQASDFDSVVLELRRRVFSAVEDTLGDSILLSGGLDTSIIAAVVASILGAGEKNRFHAFTIILNGTPAPDLNYSKLAANRFSIPQKICFVDFQDLEEALPEVIGVLKSFDPMEIRNSATVYLGLKQARQDGFSKVMTGDASDELFAGYSFVFKLQRDMARATLSHLWEVMRFSSIPLANSLGIEARLPFLEPAVREFAVNSIDYDFLIGGKMGSDEIFGKYALRRAFEDMLPVEIAWRTKTPIEYGSGTTMLPAIYSEKIDDAEFAEKKKSYFERDRVRLRDKEHLRYYEIFRNVLGPPAPKDKSKRTCPSCTSNVQEDSVFCTTCGEFPL